MRRHLLLLALAAPSCIIMSPSEFDELYQDMLDGDHDGHINAEWEREGGDDCDDDDALVYPGAEEICTGKDNDCDGYIDEGLSDWEGWYPDEDGDGYGDRNAPLERCPIPETAVQDGSDCDDGNGAFNPEASDLADDGRDQNCDGVDGIDADGDGSASLASGGEDCDDENPEVGPQVEEAPYNGVDDDCDIETPDDDVDGDGFLEEDDCDDEDWRVYPGAREICGDGVINDCYNSPQEAWELCGMESQPAEDAARGVIKGATSGQALGSVVRALGDVTGDGIPDLGIGDLRLGDEAGELYVMTRWAGDRTVGEDTVTLSMGHIDFYMQPWFSGAGDVDGDGVDDLLTVTYVDTELPIHTELGLFLGPLSSSQNMTTPAVLISATPGMNSALGDVDASADVDGDGTNDWLIGAMYLEDDQGDLQGGAWLVSGRGSGDVDLEVEGVRLHTEGGTFWGGPVRFIGDVNGDGIEDIALGTTDASVREAQAGAVYVFWGPFSNDRLIAEADWLVAGGEPGSNFGHSMAGSEDWNGDGLDDLVAGAPHAGYSSSQGRAYVLEGGQSGRTDAEDAALTVSGDSGDELCGSDVAFIQDLSADDRAELLVGTSSHDEPNRSSGLVSLFTLPVTGQVEVSDGDSLFHGTEGASLGSGLASLGDIDLNGVPDFAASAPGYTDTINNQGAVFIFSGAGP
ncbi:MAG: FG-GAP repeat protein [Alphaproteobacteria bacterium]|nr:FG-GAP repeat protein [Alphaproteobacteria bacterium]